MNMNLELRNSGKNKKMGSGFRNGNGTAKGTADARK